MSDTEPIVHGWKRRFLPPPAPGEKADPLRGASRSSILEGRISRQPGGTDFLARVQAIGRPKRED